MSTSMLFVFLGFFGGQEAIYIVAVLLFGGKKIPELARGLGKGIKEFKDAKNGVEEEKKD
jgi:sec-independent protein translocase protein TatA